MALMIFAGIVSFSLPIWALADLSQFSPDQWRRAKHDRLVWAAVVALTWIPGTLAYALVVRPLLSRPRPNTAHPPAGWYPDPRRSDRHRYHDGRIWTHFVVQR